MNFGRGIKKHPKSIYIYAPIKKKINKQLEGQQTINGDNLKEKSNKQSSVEEIDTIKCRRVVVYDISDTYLKKGAKPIPFIEDYLKADTTKELYNILISISPVPVQIQEIMGGKKGYYSKKENKIVISSELSQDDRTAVLIHELCHCLYDNFNYKEDRNKSEIFVESVAFLVADYFHFDTSMCSFGYITNWAKNDINEIMSLGEKIKETADNFIELIKANEFKQEQITA